MTRRVLIRFYWLLALGLCLTVLARTLYWERHAAAHDRVLKADSRGINHYLTNSDSADPAFERMERTITQFMRRWELQGVSIAIMREGELLYSKGVGWADTTRNDSLEVRHLIRVASLSKLITAVAVMKLQEESRLSLSDLVFDKGGILYHPRTKITDQRIKKITVEHLLRHQGGYSVRAGDPLFSLPSVARQLGTALPLDREDMVNYAARTRLRSAPGTANIYSNLGYVVLAAVVEEASGMPYEEYVKEHILHPIGCYDMHLGYSSPLSQYPHESVYYEPSNATFVDASDGTEREVPRAYGGTDLQILSGAGGWIASPTEVMRFLSAIDPQNPHPDILSAASIRTMTQDEQRLFPIGWMSTTEQGDWLRTGSLAGCSVMMKRQADGWSWIIIANTSSWSGSSFPRKMERLMRDAMAQVEQWPERDLFELAASRRAAPN